MSLHCGDSAFHFWMRSCLLSPEPLWRLMKKIIVLPFWFGREKEVFFLRVCLMNLLCTLTGAWDRSRPPRAWKCFLIWWIADKAHWCLEAKAFASLPPAKTRWMRWPCSSRNDVDLNVFQYACATSSSFTWPDKTLCWTGLAQKGSKQQGRSLLNASVSTWTLGDNLTVCWFRLGSMHVTWCQCQYYIMVAAMWLNHHFCKPVNSSLVSFFCSTGFSHVQNLRNHLMSCKALDFLQNGMSNSKLYDGVRP